MLAETLTEVQNRILAHSVSIITVCRNSALYIQRTINSVLSQKGVVVEYIIVDGASTDGTVEIIREHGHRLAHWESRPDGSMYVALNRGMEVATGDLIGIVNSDDALYDDYTLARVVASLNENKEADGIYGDQVKEEGEREAYKKVFQVDFIDYLISGKGTFVPHGSLFLRRTFVEKLGQYNTSYRFASDFDFILRALKLGNLRYVSLPISRFRVHAGSITASGRLPAERDAILEEHGYWRRPWHERWIKRRILWLRYWLQRAAYLLIWPIIRKIRSSRKEGV